VVVVDNVRSLFNVGSIFRSADGAGIHHLHLCGITPTPANPKLAKTALGAEHAVSWTYHRNSLDCAEQLRAAGYLLWALEEHAAATSIFTVPLPMVPVALVIGNEVTGVDPALLACCSTVVALPMQGIKRSLNVATAFGAAAIILAHRVATSRVGVTEQASHRAEWSQPAGAPANQRSTMPSNSPSTLPSTLLGKLL
jgi:tRNA G18 (ribose-2'-O)-methylase SpoU